MVRILEDNLPDTSLPIRIDYISNILTRNGFKSYYSDDEYIYNFSKTDEDITINLAIYIDDTGLDSYSIGITCPELPDYSYLSDYMRSEDDFMRWISKDYLNVLKDLEK